jgi:hypothetical protein
MQPPMRGLSIGARAAQIDPEVKAKHGLASFVEGLRNRKARSLSISEREQIAEVAATEIRERKHHG